jgi:neopullulanase
LESYPVPTWVSEAVFYQIFPDRFARSNSSANVTPFEDWEAPPTRYGFKGGDLFGVVERLDYLAELGINAIYFTPVFQSTANHRYHTHDFFRVDPLLGNDTALRQLLNAAHKRGIRVVLDGVFNHASRGFFQFNHILENGEHSPYLNWFHARSWPLYAYDPIDKPGGYDAWWGLKALPKFNTTTAAVRAFLLSVASHWTEFGIDGWRLDVPNEIDDDQFWQEFRNVVKSRNPEAYIVGEIWGPAERWLQGDQFDAVMNYQFMRACIEFFIGERGDRDLMQNGYGTPETADGSAFALKIDALLRRYSPAATAAMLNPLDSHDTPRFLSMARGDESTLRMAILMLMTYPGAPSIFYGDEIGIVGGKDPDMRRGMIWDQSRWNHGLREHFRNCIALRRANPSLRNGTYETLLAFGPVYAFARAHADELFIIMFNTGDQTQVISLPVPALLEGVTVVRDVWHSAIYPVINGYVWEIKLAPMTGTVLERQRERQ